MKWQLKQILESFGLKTFIFYIQASDGKVLLNLNYLDKFFNENPFISIVLQLLTRAYGTQWGTKKLNKGARVTELGYP